MDAFFASVEQRDVPTLRGKPVIVGGEREGRGIVSAASYEARKFGVHSAMSMHAARRCCPHGTFIEGNWAKYVTASLEVFATCQRLSDSVEVVSVDECTLRFSEPWDSVVAKARFLSKDIERIHGLSCSLGIAPNRLLAKLASSLGKPKGFTVLHPCRFPEIISELPARSIWGVGEKTAALLERYGVQTIGDLDHAEQVWLRALFGDRVLALVRGIRGEPDEEVQPVKERSLGHEYTFGHDVYPGPHFWAVVARLCDQVSRRLRVHGYAGSVVRVRLRRSNFETHSKQTRVQSDLWEPNTLREIVSHLLAGLLDAQRPIRLVGVTAAGLFQEVRTSLDDQLIPGIAQQKGLVRAVDSIWDRFGEDSLVRASSLMSSGYLPARLPSA